jgi:hypothetical protein
MRYQKTISARLSLALDFGEDGDRKAGSFPHGTRQSRISIPKFHSVACLSTDQLPVYRMIRNYDD